MRVKNMADSLNTEFTEKSFFLHILEYFINCENKIQIYFNFKIIIFNFNI